MSSWEFNKNVTGCFDEMLERSIPDYITMRKLVNNIVINHIQSTRLLHTNIIDLGCSRGGAIRDIRKSLPSNQFLGIETSRPMINASKEEFKYDANVRIADMDLRYIDELPVKQCGAILSVLTLVFIPIEYRQKIISQVKDSLAKNGIFVMVEKITGDNYNISQLYEDLYYDMKYQNGYSVEEIRDKKLKLEGVQVPATNQYNIDLLRNAWVS